MLWKLEDSSGRWVIIEFSCLNKEIWYQIFSKKTFNLEAHVVSKKTQKTKENKQKNPKQKQNQMDKNVKQSLKNPLNSQIESSLIFYIDGLFRE